MALSFPNQSRSFDATRCAVRFWGHDGAMEASFFASTRTCASHKSKIGGDQLVRPFATAPIEAIAAAATLAVESTWGIATARVVVRRIV
jgi:Protein of unknown function (DUF1488)